MTAVGLDNDFTQRNTTFMAWNLMHMARMLKDAGGMPAHGNQKTAWDKGERFGHPNPEYRWAMAATDFDFANDGGRELSGHSRLATFNQGLGNLRPLFHLRQELAGGDSPQPGARGSRHRRSALRFYRSGRERGRVRQGLSGDMQDIACAARAMEAREWHRNCSSATALAGRRYWQRPVPLRVRAVAVIGAPFAADHVLTHIGTTSKTLPKVSASGPIAGREFSLGADFVEDISRTTSTRIATSAVHYW